MLFSTKAEYGVRLMVELGRQPGSTPISLSSVAEAERLPLSYLEHLVAKLRKAGLVTSTRGAHGGYTLARPPERISAVEIIDAIEGPVALTECSTGHSNCTIQADCSVGGNWQQINTGIRRALEQVSLAELTRPMAIPLLDLRRRHVHS